MTKRLQKKSNIFLDVQLVDPFLPVIQVYGKHRFAPV